MSYFGIVQKGSGKGKKFGFPTVNISCEDDSISGIYAALVRFDGEEYTAAVYADTKRKLLEAHLLHFEDDLYGKEIKIELLEKMRDNRKFADENEARKTIAEDVQKVLEYFRVR